MKQLLCCAAVVLLLNAIAQSQIKPEKNRRPVRSKNIPSNKKPDKADTNNSNTILLNTSNYPAKANAGSSPAVENNFLAANKFTISDPILITLNKRANGANIKFNNSGIVGMPKRAYGFAGGHIVLSTTGAVTSGTQTGSGAVGTGTSLATFGSIGAPMNVNGKSPYAGVNMWGNAMNMNIIRLDSTIRSKPLKKQ